jgi:Flp pilus assembly protein TadD
VVTATAGYTLAAGGRREEARKILDQLKTRAAQGHAPPSNLALVHLGLGEQDKALDRLEEAVEARDMLLTLLPWSPGGPTLPATLAYRPLGEVALKQ